jgi:hypothetical protein
MTEEEFEEQAGKLDNIELGIFLFTFAAWVCFNVGYALKYTMCSPHPNYIEQDRGYQHSGFSRAFCFVLSFMYVYILESQWVFWAVRHRTRACTS